MPFGVVDADRPEGTHRNLRNVQQVAGLAIVMRGCGHLVVGVLLRIAAPGHGTADQVAYGVDLAALAEHPARIG
ncbi:hypothetical protein D9M71_793160 [compost metagenome]